MAWGDSSLSDLAESMGQFLKSSAREVEECEGDPQRRMLAPSAQLCQDFTDWRRQVQRWALRLHIDIATAKRVPVVEVVCPPGEPNAVDRSAAPEFHLLQARL